MRKYLNFIKPKTGYTGTIYNFLNVSLPLVVLFLVVSDFAWAAVLLVLLGKWRMFAMKPRYWLPNLRANMVDIFVGLSLVVFISGTSTFAVQVIWTILFLLWTVWIKPKSSQVAVAVQALIAQALALVAFYQLSPNHGIWLGVLVVWAICYISARHFLGAFEEDHYRQISAIWAWFGAGITWILEHWRIEYFTVSQIALVITIVGYTLAAMYYLYKNHKLRKNLRQQLIMFLIAALLLIVVLSEWQVSTF